MNILIVRRQQWNFINPLNSHRYEQNIENSFSPQERVGNPTPDGPIYLRITVDGERFEAATQCEICPDKWDRSGQMARGNTNDVRQLNNFLDSLRNQIYEAQRDLLNRGREVTAHALQNIWIFPSCFSPEIFLVVSIVSK